jgi:electron transfer flavoprotein alpha subunit
MSILVIVEHDQKNVKNSTYHTLAAAFQIGDQVDVCILGNGCESVIAQLKECPNLGKVIFLQHEALSHPLAETYASVLSQWLKTQEYEWVLAPATTFGKNILPRLSALLDTGMVSDVIAVEGPRRFRRPIYAGNAIATVDVPQGLVMMTVRATAFSPWNSSGGGDAEVVILHVDPGPISTQFIELQTIPSSRPELTAAPVVVSGGRGLQNGENFKILEELADLLGGAVGASRAAVDSGYVPNDYQVGQTGKIVAPNLYIAVGISGAIQHLAGMKDSKVIVAINKDPDAPIFQVADYGLVGDLFEMIPQMTDRIRSLKAS